MSSPKYAKKARLLHDITNIEQYRTIIEKDDFKIDEPHWRSISKNTITLFQVLIDQDLSDLVNVLEHYPRYTEWVCEHFRYAYSYSENEADIEAASKLLTLGEPYFSKQFVRNVVRKLPKLQNCSIEEMLEFSKYFASTYKELHPILVNYYKLEFDAQVIALGLHPLQRLQLMKPLQEVELQETYQYEADDRDAVLDIPYMT